MSSRQSSPVAVLSLAAVMAGTAFVAVTAFVLAYDGSAGAARDAGIAKAGWYPWCIEGVIVCASVATLTLKRRYPWLILLSFTAVSVAANVLHAWKQPGWQWWSLAFAAVPPLALPICVHLLLMVGRPADHKSKEERDGKREHDQRQGLQGAAGPGAQGQSGHAQQAGGRATEGQREAAPAAQVVVAAREEESADGSDAPGPVSDPSAPGLGDLMATVAASPGNGHGKTLKARAVEAAVAYHQEHDEWPNRDLLAELADCKPSTARDALALTRKG